MTLPDGFFYKGDIEAYYHMVSLVPDGGTVVEIGVHKGRSLCSIAPLCKDKCIKLTGVDPWEPEADGPAIMQECINNLNALEATASLVRGYSLQVSQSFADESVDLVFLDGPHDYENIMRDLIAWYPKVKIGGWIMGHDYVPEWPGVAQALNDFFGSGTYECRHGDEDLRCDCWAKRRGLNVSAGGIA